MELNMKKIWIDTPILASGNVLYQSDLILFEHSMICVSIVDTMKYEMIVHSTKSLWFLMW